MDKITHKVRCEQWTSIIKECLASGMPKTTWCREHGISDKAFFYWQRILREEAYLKGSACQTGRYERDLSPPDFCYYKTHRSQCG